MNSAAHIGIIAIPILAKKLINPIERTANDFSQTYICSIASVGVTPDSIVSPESYFTHWMIFIQNHY
jgi:hypothetical protein